MAPLQATVAEDTDRQVVRLAGEIDLANSPELAELLEPLAAKGPVTVDLRDVRFMDSSGLHALLNFAARSLNGNGPLTIANPSRTLLRVMDIMGIAQLPQIDIQVDDEQHG